MMGFFTDFHASLVLKSERHNEAHRSQNVRLKGRGESARIMGARRTFMQKNFKSLSYLTKDILQKQARLIH